MKLREDGILLALNHAIPPPLLPKSENFCSWLFRDLFCFFLWLFCGPPFGQTPHVLAHVLYFWDITDPMQELLGLSAECPTECCKKIGVSKALEGSIRVGPPGPFGTRVPECQNISRALLQGTRQVAQGAGRNGSCNFLWDLRTTVTQDTGKHSRRWKSAQISEKLPAISCLCRPACAFKTLLSTYWECPRSLNKVSRTVRNVLST